MLFGATRPIAVHGSSWSMTMRGSRARLEDHLRELRYIVCGHASRAEEALREASTAEADLFIVDLHRAGAAGTGALTTQLRERSHVPVLEVVRPLQPEVLRANLELALVRHDLERRLHVQSRELERSATLLGAAFDAAADGLLVVDANGRVTKTNERFFDLWRMPSAIAGGDPDEWVGFVSSQLAGDTWVAPWGLAEPEPDDGDRPRVLELRDGRVFEQIVSRMERLSCSLVTFRDVTHQRLAASDSIGVATLSGDAFFDEIVSQLTRLLGVDGAFVCVIVPASDEPRVRTLSRWFDGGKAPPIEFDLHGSPCEVALGETSVVVGANVREQFKGVPLLEEMDASGYAAVALLDRKGRAIGSIGITSRTALNDATRVATTLRLLAVRTAAELERGRAEARFHELFELSPDGILMVDTEGVIVLANQRAELLFQYPRAELIGLSVEKLMPEANGPKHVELRRRFLAASEPRSMGSRDRPLYARRRDGTTFPIDIGLGPLRTDDGVLVIAAVRDISERVSADLERRALEEQLRQSQKMEALGTLAGGIAHDFNNLLTIITANLELARPGAGGSVAERLGDIASAASRASVLVRQILAFSRQQPRRSVLIDLQPLVEEVAQLLRAPLPANVTIALAIASSPRVLADPDQIHQVLMNLGTNAWHAIGGEAGQIVVQVEGVDLGVTEAARLGISPGRHARIAVSDDGAGMVPETQRRIFEPFFTTKGVGRGTGLGLSVAHGIIRESGGAIAVDSQPGRGTTFSVYLPAAVGEVAEPTLRPKAPAASGQGRVLFLDDELLVIRVATLLLRNLGYEPTGFVRAADAIEAVRADPDAFDIVITDWSMPDMGGPEVVRALLALQGRLRIGITSGQPPSPDEERAMAGIPILEKPFAVSQLANFLERLRTPRPD